MSTTPDLTNQRILALLQADARITASAIGERIGLSRQAVQSRIKAMEDNGTIRGYHADIGDPDAAGVHAVLWVKITERPCDKALEWLDQLQGTTAVYSLSGDCDALAHITLPTHAHLSALNDAVAASPLISDSHCQIVLRRYCPAR